MLNFPRMLPSSLTAENTPSQRRSTICFSGFRALHEVEGACRPDRISSLPARSCRTVHFTLQGLEKISKGLERVIVVLIDFADGLARVKAQR